MALGVCHKIDRHARHKIGSNDLAADKGLEAVFPRLRVLDIRTFVDAGPIREFRGRESRPVGIVSFLSRPIGGMPGDGREGFRFGASPGTGEGLLSGGHRITTRLRLPS